MLASALNGQTAGNSHAYASDLGFSYEVPSDWEVVTRANMAQAKEQAAQSASSEQEKKGLACAQMGMTTRREGSVIVDVSLSFDCFGQQLTEADLPNFGDGASQGLKQSFDVGEPAYGSYSLGSHKMWAERVKGSPKGQGSTPYTIEIACAILKKGAVCWMALAADEPALQAFERSHAALDGETASVLVPPGVFKPAEGANPARK
ncbi:hypothetical protein DYQ86_07350 [Acidobacteria bacterium AB60]|nr:hypothetical protein DYQ86_07350 [Acidobacteria bacterium AB60]